MTNENEACRPFCGLLYYPMEPRHFNASSHVMEVCAKETREFQMPQVASKKIAVIEDPEKYMLRLSRVSET